MNAVSDAHAPRIGAIGRVLAWALRKSRIARGWRIETRPAFAAAVHTTARFVEAHPGLLTFWSETRVVRLCALQAKLMEVLTAKCGSEVRIWQLVCDDQGAMGEVCLGEWVEPFRINLRR